MPAAEPPALAEFRDRADGLGLRVANRPRLLRGQDPARHRHQDLELGPAGLLGAVGLSAQLAQALPTLDDVPSTRAWALDLAFLPEQPGADLVVPHPAAAAGEPGALGLGRVPPAAARGGQARRRSRFLAATHPLELLHGVPLRQGSGRLAARI